MENYGVTESQTVTIETLERFHNSNQTRYRHWHNRHHDIIVWRGTGVKLQEELNIELCSDIFEHD
jgi:hypothetical protein